MALIIRRKTFTKICFLHNDHLSYLLLTEAATAGVYKKNVLRNFAKFTGKQLCRSVSFNKTSQKPEALAQTFSCEFCKIFKSIFSTEHLRATASV